MVFINTTDASQTSMLLHNECYTNWIASKSHSVGLMF